MPNRLASLVLIVALWLPTSASAQQSPPPAANPLATLYDALQQALAETGVPLSPEQQRAIVLMMEDRRKASEELFGDLRTRFI